MDEARKRISDISDFSVKLSEVLEFLVKDNLEFKNTVKKDNDTLKGKIQQLCWGTVDHCVSIFSEDSKAHNHGLGLAVRLKSVDLSRPTEGATQIFPFGDWVDWE